MKKLLLPLALVLALYGCDTPVSTHEPQPSGENLHVDITASVNSLAKSRTAIAGEAVSFSGTDKIGVFETTTNVTSAVEWTYDGSAWSSTVPMYWKDKTTAHNFYAFYPYAAATNAAEILMPSLAAQVGDAAGVAGADFLYATPVTNKTYAPSVDFSFNHASALLVLNVKSSTAADGGAFTSFTIGKDASNAATQYKYDIQTPAAVTAGATAAHTVTVTPAPGAALSQSGATYYVVVNDQTPEGLEFNLSFTKDGVEHPVKGILDIPETADKFVAGSKYTYNITIDLTGMAMGNMVVNPWKPVEGGDIVAN